MSTAKKFAAEMAALKESGVAHQEFVDLARKSVRMAGDVEISPEAERHALRTGMARKVDGWGVKGALQWIKKGSAED